MTPIYADKQIGYTQEWWLGQREGMGPDLHIIKITLQTEKEKELYHCYSYIHAQEVTRATYSII